MRHSFFRWTAPLVFGLVAFSVAPGLFAQPRWTAEIGLGRSVVPGTWAPLRLESGGGTGSWSLAAQGQLIGGREVLIGSWEFPGAGLFERPVFLPAGLEALRLTRSNPAGDKSQITISISELSFPGNVILVDGVSTRTQDQLAQWLMPGEPLRVVELEPSRWPSSFLTWGAVTAVVVKDPGPVLSPVQAVAAKAWVASGGQLVILDKKPGSLREQLDGAPGLGRILDRIDGLILQPFGSQSRAGTDFDPDTLPLSSGKGAASPLVWGALGLWTVVALLLAWRKKPSPLAWVVCSTLVSASVLVLFYTESLPWDRGVLVHTRQVVLPASAGVVTSVLAQNDGAMDSITGWPVASPWGLGLWTEARKGLPMRVVSPGYVGLMKWGREVTRSTPYRIRGGKLGLLWWESGRELETAPDRFATDLRWLERLAAAYPGRDWLVGLTEAEDGGTLCWVSLAAQESQS